MRKRILCSGFGERPSDPAREGRSIATATRWPGSLQRMVRRHWRHVRKLSPPYSNASGQLLDLLWSSPVLNEEDNRTPVLGVAS